MSDEVVVTRFAPSPSGELHLGNAHTALFNFLLARGRGRFVLRVEDTDAGRSGEQFVQALSDDLRWLGLSWDEGPDGGANGPYRQSQRRAIYDRYLAQLERDDRAYPCFCTALELELSRRAQLAAGRPPRYAGTCSQLGPGERTERSARGLKSSLRFRVPPGRRVEFDDLVFGPQVFQSDDIGDFIVRREDGTAAFFAANAIDDALMHITHVLRGDDHLSNTPRQLLLLEALQLPAPRYAHLALLLGADGTPLSKRHGAASVRELREAGYAPEAVCNHLFRLGHSSADNGILTLAQMAQLFQLAHLQRAPAHFELTQLRHWQSEWVHALTPDAARDWLRPALRELEPARVPEFIAAVLPNVVFADDVRLWERVVYQDPLEFEPEAEAAARAAGAQFFAAAAAALREPPDLAAIRAATGRKGAAFFMPLRAALTGRLHGPELAPLLRLMPGARARARLLAFARD